MDQVIRPARKTGAHQVRSLRRVGLPGPSAARFAATLKMSSTRVIGAELVNSENLSGYHTADGALYLYREGRRV